VEDVEEEDLVEDDDVEEDEEDLVELDDDEEELGEELVDVPLVVEDEDDGFVVGMQPSNRRL